MQYRKQKKYFDALKKYERKMENKESEKYKMLLKRHKDEEDLDKLSLAYLEGLYEKYYVNRDKRNFDDFFKKPEKSD